MNGYQPDEEAWENVIEFMRAQCDIHTLSDQDAIMAISMGIAAFTVARKWGAKFIHD